MLVIHDWERKTFDTHGHHNTFVGPCVGERSILSWQHVVVVVSTHSSMKVTRRQSLQKKNECPWQSLHLPLPREKWIGVCAFSVGMKEVLHTEVCNKTEPSQWVQEEGMVKFAPKQLLFFFNQNSRRGCLTQDKLLYISHFLLILILLLVFTHQFSAHFCGCWLCR